MQYLRNDLGFPQLTDVCKEDLWYVGLSKMSETNVGNEPTGQTGPHDLLIIGAGRLGDFIAAEWHKRYPDANITGETRTKQRHDTLRKAGIHASFVGNTKPVPLYMVFCAPAGGKYEEYTAAVKTAVARARPETRFVFTSSGSVHGPDSITVTESTPPGPGVRAKMLSTSENAVLEHPNGVVVRLSGLYSIDHAAHKSILGAGVVSFSKNAEINFLHYADAASAVILALLFPKSDLLALPRRTFLAAAKQSITVQHICDVALKHPKYSSESVPKFIDCYTPGWKKYNAEWTMQVLGWKPKWESYDDFMQEDAKRYEENHSAKEKKSPVKSLSKN